jgi:hypothetical protein
MGKNKKFEMSVVDEGYDDKTWEEFELEKAKLREKMVSEENKGFNPFDSKNVVIMIVWALLYKLFIKWEFGIMYAKKRIYLF